MYNEILRLKGMLEAAHIPFYWKVKHFDGHQISYPDKGKDTRICSVIEFQGSYGSEDDLLEIMGLMTSKEKQEEDDDVLGYLTAENVFSRIKKHWDRQQKEIGGMKVFIWRCKDDNKIALVRTMSEDDFLMLHKTKENVLRIIERKNADEKERLKVELIEDPMIMEMIEWYAENNRPIVIEGVDFLKRRLEDLEGAACNLQEEIAALKETLFEKGEINVSLC